MKNPFRKDSKLDGQIDKILEEMALYSAIDSEYATLSERLKELRELQATETWTRRLNPDQVATALGNLGIVAVIAAYEQKHVLTSKGFGFMRTKSNM